MQNMKLSIIIPVYNEYSSIDTVLEEVRSTDLPCGISKEIIIIDDGSTDGTKEKLERYSTLPEIKIISNRKNSGKSAAVSIGIAASTGEIILIQDADREYSPRDYPLLLEAIIQKGCPVVYGSRFKNKTTTMPLLNRIANMIATTTFNLLFHTTISDVCTGFKMFMKETVNGMQFTPKGFLFDIEITLFLHKRGYAITEVPIRYTARTKREGKKMTWLLALKHYRDIIWCRIIY